MLTFDDKGGGGWVWGSKKPQNSAYVIHGCSLTLVHKEFYDNTE